MAKVLCRVCKRGEIVQSHSRVGMCRACAQAATPEAIDIRRRISIQCDVAQQALYEAAAKLKTAQEDAEAMRRALMELDLDLLPAKYKQLDREYNQ